MNYSWNISDWVNRTLPARKRQPVTISWLVALLTPLQTLSSAFAAWAIDSSYKANYNGQTIVLKSLLDDLFDPNDRSIEVLTLTDIKFITPLYFRSEAKPKFYTYFRSEATTNPYVYLRSERFSTNSFIVRVPSSQSSKNAEITQWINRYKIAGKTFTIIYF